ncbi:MAG: response regulator [Phototrophicaceae bacterium]|jgi:two-component system cell cycle response regulator DivK
MTDPEKQPEQHTQDAATPETPVEAKAEAPTEVAQVKADVAEIKAEVARPKLNATDIDLSKINALVVEDDAGGMAIIGVMMRFLNIKAYINTTGEGVPQMARAMRPRPDIIFCDINLPRTTGYDVLKEIRADNELKDILVIAVTAQDADTEIPKARDAGFNGYIGKPLNRMRFPKQVRRIMAGEEVWETY